MICSLFLTIFPFPGLKTLASKVFLIHVRILATIRIVVTAVVVFGLDFGNNLVLVTIILQLLMDGSSPNSVSEKGI